MLISINVWNFFNFMFTVLFIFSFYYLLFTFWPLDFSLSYRNLCFCLNCCVLILIYKEVYWHDSKYVCLNGSRIWIPCHTYYNGVDSPMHDSSCVCLGSSRRCHREHTDRFSLAKLLMCLFVWSLEIIFFPTAVAQIARLYWLFPIFY